jgi:membrane fusion protein, multidrug efflux system
MFNHQPMVRRRRLGLQSGLVLAGFLGVLGVSGCDHAVPEAAAQAKEAALRVRTAPVGKGPVDKPIRGTGVVLPKQTMDLSFKLGGVLASVDVDDGQRVKKGQVLARIDPTEVAANVAQADESLAKAERDAARTRTLHDGKVVTQSDLDNAKTGVSIAKSASVAAGFNLRHTLLLAPADGWIDLRSAEPGEVVAPGRPVLRFSSESKGWVAKVALVDRDALALTSGALAEITLDAAPTQTLTGKVENVATAADPRTGTFAVEIALDVRPKVGVGATEQVLRSGLTAKVRFPQKLAAPFVVPIAALSSGDRDRAVVFSADGAVARRRSVRVAFLDGDRAAISEGLDGVSSVIISGVADLREGAAIDVAPVAETAP